MRLAVHPRPSVRYTAFYSSEIGGLTTEAAFMVVHMDDDLICRNHAVSEMSRIEHGHLYLLDRHLERIFKSASGAHIPLPFPKNRIRNIILETCAASLTTYGEVRIWLSTGRGNSRPKMSDSKKSSLYVQVNENRVEFPNFTERWRLMTTSFPSEGPMLAQVNSTTCLPDVLCCREARNKNVHLGVFVDVRDYVADSSNPTFLIYTGGKRLLMPYLDNGSPKCTAQRIFELVNHFLANDTPRNRKDYGWLYENIQSVEFVPPMRPHEMCALAKELFVVDGNTILMPVYSWDGQWIGDQFVQTTSELFTVLYTLLRQDMVYPGYDASLLTPIPYSTLTGRP
jgi:4-amino-4-deoxychorismate lyase